MIESLNCNSCGASLDVPESANFVKCNHCGQSLAVRRGDSATFTEAIDKLSAQADALSEQVGKLTMQNELDQISRNWELEQQKYMVADKHGHRRLPNEGNAVVGGVVIAVFGVIWTVIASQMALNAPFGGITLLFPLFGIVFIGVGVVTSILQFQKAKDYRVAQRRYLKRRAEIKTKFRS